jgi:Na+-transporting methylmalonyl-CoA/oxaloacetate decarboxylase gamma subunit
VENALDWRSFDLAAPTLEHELLAQTLREFVSREVEPQAADHDRREAFNHPLFRSAGELGLLGVTLPEEHGGAGLDATAAVRETLSTTGEALLFTSLVLASGFFIYMFASMTNLFYFGLLTGITIILAFLADLILAPALMSLLARRMMHWHRETPSNDLAPRPAGGPVAEVAPPLHD